MSYTPPPAPFMIINIHVIKVNSFENASAINVGQNLLAEWHNSDKKTMGLGQNNGDGTEYVGTRSMVDDRDQIDAPSVFEAARPVVPR